MIEHASSPLFNGSEARILCAKFNIPNVYFRDKSMDLTLLLDSSASALVLCSTSGVSLGNVVLPGGSVSFTLDILPATVGFQVNILIVLCMQRCEYYYL